MNIQNVGTLFSHHRHAFKNLQKTCVANARLNITKGTRLAKRMRKYIKPELLEDPFYTGVGPKEKVNHVYDSLKARGFGGEQKSYNPPSDVQEQLHQLCKKVFGSQLNSEWKSQSLSDRVLKYKLLTEAIKLFDKDIPSSDLYRMKEVKDVHEFFCTAVDGSYHYDSLVQNRDKLPPNLQVMPEAAPFNPATDTFFDGVTAFPGRKRIVFTKKGEKYEKIIQWPRI